MRGARPIYSSTSFTIIFIIDANNEGQLMCTLSDGPPNTAKSPHTYLADTKHLTPERERERHFMLCATEDFIDFPISPLCFVDAK